MPESLERFARENLELLHRFGIEDNSGGLGVHTFSVCRDPSGDGYLGYAGPVMDGTVDLWTSPDLKSWERHPSTPILQRTKLRWPTVVRDGDTVFMTIRGGHLNRTATLKSYLRRAAGKLPNVRGTEAMRVDLYRSPDGRSFERVTSLVGPGDTGNPYNRIPFLFRDPQSGRFVLVYYSGTFSRFEIRLRAADRPDDLPNAPDQMLLQSNSLLAAPALTYDGASGRYLLFCEAFDEERGVWTTRVFPSDRLTDGFDRSSGPTVFPDNRACAFPYTFDGTDYITVSHCTNKVSYGSTDRPWEGEIYRVSQRGRSE